MLACELCCDARGLCHLSTHWSRCRPCHRDTETSVNEHSQLAPAVNCQPGFRQKTLRASSSLPTNATCGTHTLCVSGGAQHSPANLYYTSAQICINLYVFHVADSSRCVVEAIFNNKFGFPFFSVSHSKISNNLFWVILMFNQAENCTEFNFINQIKMYISDFLDSVRYSSLFFKIDTFPSTNSLKGSRSPEGVPDSEIFGRVLRTM